MQEVLLCEGMIGWQANPEVSEDQTLAGLVSAEDLVDKLNEDAVGLGDTHLLLRFLTESKAIHSLKYSNLSC